MAAQSKLFVKNPSESEGGGEYLKTHRFTRERFFTVVGLVLVIVVGSFLRFYQLGANSIGNTYYAATVQSMLTSWHNFFYAAFEPGGSVSVDKPPLGFWFQAISAYFLGVNGFSLALPQALAGVLSIPLLYTMIKRPFGVWAGLIAALVLAVMPVTIATERNNTMDGTLIFMLLLATWAFLKSVREGRFRYLLLGGFLVGLGFNIKMLQAFMVLPALYALYFLGAPYAWWKRIVHLMAATVLLLLVSFAWVVAVDLTPADSRPFVGGSTDNTMLELIIGHNGLARLGLRNPNPPGNMASATNSPVGQAPMNGQPHLYPPPGGQFQQAPGGQGLMNGQPDLYPPPAGQFQQAPGWQAPMYGQPGSYAPPGGQFQQAPGGQAPRYGQPGSFPPPGGQFQQAPWGQAPMNGQPGSFPPPGGQFPQGPGMDNPPGNARPGNPRSQEVGEAGVLRLFTEPLAEEASWLLPLALLGILLVVVALGWKWPLSEKHLALVLWAGWLLPMLVYFSFTTGLWHTYYLTMLGPALAALVAASAWALWQVIEEYHAFGWILTAYLTGITLIFQIITFWQFPNYALPVTVTIIVTWLLGMALFAWRQPKSWLGNVAVVLVCINLLIAPLTLSGLTTFNTHPDVGLPNAGLDAGQAAEPNLLSMQPAAEKVILAYLLANTAPGSYLVATLDSHQAAPYILATKRPVLTFGGFSGSDNVISVDQLAQMVTSGELRFILAGPQLTQRKPEIGNWVTQHCSIVTSAGMTPPSTATSQIQRPGGMQPLPSTLYDCAID